MYVAHLRCRHYVRNPAAALITYTLLIYYSYLYFVHFRMLSKLQYINYGKNLKPKNSILEFFTF